MAEISPFRALHYDRVPDLASVVTQPYDKISAEMQARYYDRSPHNLVRIIRGRSGPADGPSDNVYTRAARDFSAWIREGVMSSMPEPSIYPYTQEYEVPGQRGPRKQRRGFSALLRIEDYSAGVVHRHEETLSGPKADRLELLKATRAHFGQIFLLYSDPAGEVEKVLGQSTQAAPWEEATDDYGTRHVVWRASGPEAAEVARLMRSKKLVIADGHHRYETALAYRDLCRKLRPGDERAEFVMATFVRMETEGLTILPTHRLVHSLPNFDWAKFSRDAQTVFDWEEIKARPPAKDWLPRVLGQLAEAGKTQPSVLAYAGPERMALLSLRRDFDLAAALPDVAPTLRRLDVVLLHRLVLERLLGIDRQAVREEKNLSYHREAELATAEVDAGRGQVAFLLNPTPVEAVHENALAGCPMPQKSTDFYPKLLSGLTIYWLDNPAGM